MQRSHLAADLATSYVRGTRAAVQEVRSQRAVSRGSIRSHHSRHWQLYVSQGPVPVPRLPKFPSSPRLCSWPSPILSNSCCRRHRRCRRRRRLRYSIVDRHPAQPSPTVITRRASKQSSFFFPSSPQRCRGHRAFPSACARASTMSGRGRGSATRCRCSTWICQWLLVLPAPSPDDAVFLPAPTSYWAARKKESRQQSIHVSVRPSSQLPLPLSAPTHRSLHTPSPSSTLPHGNKEK